MSWLRFTHTEDKTFHNDDSTWVASHGEHDHMLVCVLELVGLYGGGNGIANSNTSGKSWLVQSFLSGHYAEPWISLGSGFCLNQHQAIQWWWLGWFIDTDSHRSHSKEVWWMLNSWVWTSVHSQGMGLWHGIACQRKLGYVMILKHSSKI